MKNWKVKVTYDVIGGVQTHAEYTIKAKTEKSALSKAYQIIGDRSGFITNIEQM